MPAVADAPVVDYRLSLYVTGATVRSLRAIENVRRLCEARKHGALTDGQGRVNLTWSTGEKDSQPVLLLQWREQGGPAVKTPARRGFGSTLIERSLASIGGRTDIRFAASGVTRDMAVPMPAPQDDGAP